ncbi:hypothetical protein JC861_14275 [Morganella morganii]|uniref:hypothetical protein n=1 Tax=Morganella morganii TaxID=582 RepID=UPI001C45E13B|nr:hypothetical protein [Morganella morganii]QXO49006.1 hypothetical protein JC861_14275 [Morganella morganii]
MEFKGTPGPWYTSNEGRLLVRDEEWQCVIADSIGCNGEEEEVANARLISAAPEMLDALIKIVEMNQQYAIDKYGDVRKAEEMSCVRTARAAINKALGCE